MEEQQYVDVFVPYLVGLACVAYTCVSRCWAGLRSNFSLPSSTLTL